MDATQSVGICAFAAATLACATRRPAAVMPALVFAVAAVEVPIGLRYRLHNLVKERILHIAQPIADQTHVQYLLIGVALLAAAVVGATLLRRVDAVRGAIVALFALTAVETVSLHRIDAILYRDWGPLMLIGWLWLAIALTATAGALRGASAATGRHSPG